MPGYNSKRWHFSTLFGEWVRLAAATWEPIKMSLHLWWEHSNYLMVNCLESSVSLDLFFLLLPSLPISILHYKYLKVEYVYYLLFIGAFRKFLSILWTTYHMTTLSTNASLCKPFFFPLEKSFNGILLLPFWHCHGHFIAQYPVRSFKTYIWSC